MLETLEVQQGEKLKVSLKLISKPLAEVGCALLEISKVKLANKLKATL